MNEFDRIVEKQEEIEQLKRDKKALIERLEASHRVMDGIADAVESWFKTEEERGDTYFDLISELAPNEELLIKLK